MGGLNVNDTLSNLGDFAENLRRQISHNVVEPLNDYHASIGVATRAARA